VIEVTPRRCIFCGSAQLTREHVLGDWSRRLAQLVDASPTRHTFHPGDGSPSRAVDFLAPPLTQTARVVCAGCNNGWMSEIESNAANVLAPLLRGEPATLRPEDQTALATWAFKTAYVIDAAALGSGGAQFPAVHRRWMLEHRRPPTMSAAWITAWPGTTSAWTHHWGLEAVEQEQEATGLTNAYGATIALGPVVLRVYAATAEPLAPEYLIEDRPGVFRVWPATGDIAWHPRFWLSAEELEELAYSIPRALEGGIAPDVVPFFDADRPELGPARPV
jgi:hypothetical protein